MIHYLMYASILGALALYSANSNDYELVRMLLDMTPRGKDMGPNALSISVDGRKLAFIGPTEYTVCVVDARSLDEVQIKLFFKMDFVGLKFV